jgi:hypothetical protein
MARLENELPATPAELKPNHAGKQHKPDKEASGRNELLMDCDCPDCLEQGEGLGNLTHPLRVGEQCQKRQDRPDRRKFEHCSKHHQCDHEIKLPPPLRRNARVDLEQGVPHARVFLSRQSRFLRHVRKRRPGGFRFNCSASPDAGAGAPCRHGGAVLPASGLRLSGRAGFQVRPLCACTQNAKLTCLARDGFIRSGAMGN